MDTQKIIDAFESVWNNCANEDHAHAEYMDGDYWVSVNRFDQILQILAVKDGNIDSDACCSLRVVVDEYLTHKRQKAFAFLTQATLWIALKLATSSTVRMGLHSVVSRQTNTEFIQCIREYLTLSLLTFRDVEEWSYSIIQKITAMHLGDDRYTCLKHHSSDSNSVDDLSIHQKAVNFERELKEIQASRYANSNDRETAKEWQAMMRRIGNTNTLVGDIVQLCGHVRRIQLDEMGKDIENWKLLDFGKLSELSEKLQQEELARILGDRFLSDDNSRLSEENSNSDNNDEGYEGGQLFEWSARSQG